MFVFQEYNSIATKTTTNILHHMSISTGKMLVLCCRKCRFYAVLAIVAE
jgi:hypothetical protein